LPSTLFATIRDPRVRLAFNYAFDFEEMNRQIFYGQYKRITSYFEGTDLASSGLPTDRELELSETVRDKVPPEVFTRAYSNPVGGDPTAVRKNLLEAVRLLKDAGYGIRDQLLVDSRSGEPFAVEFLSSYPILERVFLFYKPSLERVGITVSVRTVDEAQYENRLRSWDFDVVTYAWGEARLPGSELRDYWGSEAAAQPGSRNGIGIENPAVNALIRLVLLAEHYDNLVAAVRAPVMGFESAPLMASAEARRDKALVC
jgi:microcin C transport system substrate-binding protein